MLSISKAFKIQKCLQVDYEFSPQYKVDYEKQNQTQLNKIYKVISINLPHTLVS